MVQPIQSPFVWGSDGKPKSPAEVARDMEVARALATAKPQADGFWGAVGQIGNAAVGNVLQGRADQAYADGRQSAADLFASLGPGASADTISQALLNPAAEWATPAQTGVAEALFNSQLRQQDPAYQLDLAYKQAQLDALRNPAQDPTSAIQNYEYLIRAGVDPSAAQGMAFGGGGTTINNMGNIPAGYELFENPETGSSQMRPIPGSPAFIEAQNAQDKVNRQGQSRDVVTDTIVNEANNARAAAEGFGATGVGNFLTGGVGFTPAGNLNQSVESLKAIAASENINAMRQASPTGGALGNTSDADLRLLQNKAGALNPQAPNFARQLDDYERTLLQIVHGYEAGEKIYRETREQPDPSPGGSVPSVGAVEDGYRFRGGNPSDPSSWEKVN